MEEYEPNLKTFTILWNGGWDDLEVDLNRTRPLTKEEQQDINKSEPFIEWNCLRMSFLPQPYYHKGLAVKITRKIASGD
jgi:hypothetical protein